jgi:hypothetical protein
MSVSPYLRSLHPLGEGGSTFFVFSRSRMADKRALLSYYILVLNG